MRIARGKSTISGNGVELVGVDQLENGREEIQAVIAGVLLHLALDFDQLRRQRVQLWIAMQSTTNDEHK